MTQKTFVEARVKTSYKHPQAVLMGGIGFSKTGWTPIPPGKEELAHRYEDILEFREVDQPAPFSGNPPDVPTEMKEQTPAEETLVPDLTTAEEEEVTKQTTRRPRKKKDETAEE